MSATNVKRPSLLFRLARRLGGEVDYGSMLVAGLVAPTPNSRSLRIFAQRRSGHHAIINWIRYQLRGRHYFLNDCRAGENPFRTAQVSGSLVRGLFGDHRVMRLGQEQRRRFTYKGTLLYGYEEYDIRNIARDMPAEKELHWVGPSRSHHDILIMRDPFNLIASKLRWARGKRDTPSKPSIEQLDTARELWKVYAREYLGLSGHLKDRICVSYNHWFVSRRYRDELAGRLGLVNDDRGIEQVAKWGPTVWGDSFDGLKYDGRAQEMKVLERWREFENDDVYRKLIADDELHDLSQQIFGELAGVDTLRAAR